MLGVAPDSSASLTSLALFHYGQCGPHCTSDSLGVWVRQSGQRRAEGKLCGCDGSRFPVDSLNKVHEALCNITRSSEKMLVQGPVGVWLERS